jgi:hypothetical protein
MQIHRTLLHFICFDCTETVLSHSTCPGDFGLAKLLNKEDLASTVMIQLSIRSDCDVFLYIVNSGIGDTTRTIICLTEFSWKTLLMLLVFSVDCRHSELYVSRTSCRHTLWLQIGHLVSR